jgi:hypothetical protein
MGMRVRDRKAAFDQKVGKPVGDARNVIARLRQMWPLQQLARCVSLGEGAFVKIERCGRDGGEQLVNSCSPVVVHPWTVSQLAVIQPIFAPARGGLKQFARKVRLVFQGPFDDDIDVALQQRKGSVGFRHIFVRRRIMMCRNVHPDMALLRKWLPTYLFGNLDDAVDRTGALAWMRLPQASSVKPDGERSFQVRRQPNSIEMRAGEAEIDSPAVKLREGV